MLWSLSPHAQSLSKALRVGTMSLNVRYIPQRTAFELRLRELGYIEGHNLVIEFITTPDRFDRIDEAARALIQRNADVFVLENHITLKSVMSATSTSSAMQALARNAGRHDHGARCFTSSSASAGIRSS